VENKRFYITIYKPGTNLKEIRLILNKLTLWNQPQIQKYLENPFEFEVCLDSIDYKMLLIGLNNHCPNSEYKIIDTQEKRIQKLNQIGI
jgi:Flp pilus assembly CpaE family ATPase